MTDLRDLPKKLDEKKLHDMAVAIRKYQDHRLSIAVSKIEGDLSLATKKAYINGGVSYIKMGKKTKGVPTSLYKAIDKVLAECVQPLTPSEADRKRVYKRNYTKKDNIPPVARLDIVKKPVTVKVSYGVKIMDNVKCLPSYDEAVGFLKGIKYMGDTVGTLVSFEGLEEVK